jgi:hypothetical protein
MQQATPRPAVESHPSCSRRQFGSAPTQAALNFEPCLIRVAVPPQAPARSKGLQRACLHILELLSDGRPHAWHELQAVGGSRANARVGELRRAGYVVLGPLGWRRLDGEREIRREPLGPGETEMYRRVAA